MKQELDDQTQSCVTATDKAATLQAELETLGRNVSSLQGQLGGALQDLIAEQQRHKDVQKTAQDLQAQLQGVQQELLAERQACVDGEIQKAAAQQSASSLQCRLQTAQQLLENKEWAHMVAVADHQRESRAAQGSFEANSKVVEQTVASLENELREALRGSRNLQQVSTSHAEPMSAVCDAAPRVGMSC